MVDWNWSQIIHAVEKAENIVLVYGSEAYLR